MAKQRIELRCSLEPGHAGPHQDGAEAQEWVVVQGRPSMNFRDENE